MTSYFKRIANFKDPGMDAFRNYATWYEWMDKTQTDCDMLFCPNRF